MELVVLPSTLDGCKGQPLSTYVINGRLAIDGGAIGVVGSIQQQMKITDVLVTHSHLDHVASLPILVDNVYNPDPACVRVHATKPTLKALKHDIFNERIYPDMIEMSQRMAPFLQLFEIKVRKPFELADCTITAIPVNHVVPTVAFIIDDGEAAVAIVTDTGPTDEIWEAIKENPRVQAVFLECSFPNELVAVAKAAMHLTPKLFAAEIKKIPDHVSIHAVHLKPRFYDTLVQELDEIGDKRVKVSQPGKVYRFKPHR
jgi:ribonuclease BN (tRNA processing enzyme)